MAQQVEHILGKDEVVGSNPISSSRKKRCDIATLFLLMTEKFIFFEHKTTLVPLIF